MLTQRLPGTSLPDLAAMDRDDVLDMLGVEVSPMRIKCAVLAEKVVQDGAKLYEGDLEGLEDGRTTTEE
jgi:nitrogen fixation NifU-like protein